MHHKIQNRLNLLNKQSTSIIYNKLFAVCEDVCPVAMLGALTPHTLVAVARRKRVDAVSCMIKLMQRLNLIICRNGCKSKQF